MVVVAHSLNACGGIEHIPRKKDFFFECANFSGGYIARCKPALKEGMTSNFS